MQIAKYKTCIVDGCGKQTHGRAYCSSHLKYRRASTPISKKVLVSMRSRCCKAPCTTGEQHEYGKQYCSRCKNACIWIA